MNKWLMMMMNMMMMINEINELMNDQYMNNK